MKSHLTARFRKSFQSLPPPIRRKAREVFRLWRHNPGNPLLHFKRVHKVRPIYSIRIALGWRAVGVKSGDQMIWFWIGSHADYDSLLKQL